MTERCTVAPVAARFTHAATVRLELVDTLVVASVSGCGKCTAPVCDVYAVVPFSDSACPTPERPATRVALPARVCVLPWSVPSTALPLASSKSQDAAGPFPLLTLNL